MQSAAILYMPGFPQTQAELVDQVLKILKSSGEFHPVGFALTSRLNHPEPQLGKRFHELEEATLLWGHWLTRVATDEQ
jgi:hypothetical protein